MVVLLLIACGQSESAITDIQPRFGLMHGGEQIVIHGENMDALMPVTVYLGNERVRMSELLSDNILQITTPTSRAEQTVDVRIIGNDGREFLMKSAFQYVEKAEMAECVNISKQLNGKPVLERVSKRK